MSGKNTASLLVIAIALGAAGAGLSMLYLKARESDLVEALKPKSPPIDVVVAAKDLVKGDKLSANTLSIRKIPSDFVDPNAIKPAEFESIKDLVLIQNLASGKPLLRSFIDQEFPLDFSDTIPLKRRAMTIQVDETNTISGLLRPGNRIDLFVNLPASATGEDTGKGNQIMPVVENIEVLATGRDAARDYEEKVRLLRLGYGSQPDQNYTTLTLNVTAKEAALIAMSQDKGNMLALLRNRKDDSGSGFVTVSTNTLSGNARDLAQQAVERAKYKSAGKLTTNANGDVIDANGNVLTGLKLNEDGTVTLPDGRRVAASEISIGTDGKVHLKNGEAIKGVTTLKSVGKLTTNANGDVVDANGNILTGVKLNADGTVTLPDGSVVNADQLAVGSNGEITLTNGKVIKGVKSVKPVGKLTTNANGDVVDANGNILTGVKMNADGTVTLPDGTIVSADKLTVGANGEVSLSDGTPVKGVNVVKPAGKLTTNSKGEVVDENGNVLSGLKLNKDGTVTLPDGTKVAASDITIGANGEIMLKNGKKVEGAKAIKTIGKLTADAAGTVVDANGNVLAGLKLNEDGTVTLPDGRKVDASDIVMNDDGSVSLRNGEVIKGVKVITAEQASAYNYEIDYIVGGISEDSVATVQKLSVDENENISDATTRQE